MPPRRWSAGLRQPDRLSGMASASEKSAPSEFGIDGFDGLYLSSVLTRRAGQDVASPVVVRMRCPPSTGSILRRRFAIWPRSICFASM
jgi:hypothetical protein